MSTAVHRRYHPEAPQEPTQSGAEKLVSNFPVALSYQRTTIFRRNPNFQAADRQEQLRHRDVMLGQIFQRNFLRRDRAALHHYRVRSPLRNRPIFRFRPPSLPPRPLLWLAVRRTPRLSDLFHLPAHMPTSFRLPVPPFPPLVRLRHLHRPPGRLGIGLKSTISFRRAQIEGADPGRPFRRSGGT